MIKKDLIQIIHEAGEREATELDLSSCDIFVIPDELFDLTSLTELSLSNNSIAELPEDISKLTNLKKLVLRFNKLTSLPAKLFELKNLEVLDVSGNMLSEVPESISAFSELRELHISDNSILGLPTSFRRLKKLEILYFRYGVIKDIPNEIFRLKQLKELFLDANGITEIPDKIKLLSNLEILYLGSNRLAKLPSELSELKHLRVLGIEYNLLKIPIEIVAGGDPQKILNYYVKSLSGLPINEAKIVIVGEANVGKTCLIKRLLHETFNPAESRTHGIEIYPWENVRVNNETVKLNIWDFGGQEIMHATHQFFFTKRTVYVLVINARENIDEHKAEDWLKRIENFGGKSPVIIVGNKIDGEFPHKDKTDLGYFDVDEKGLKGRFKNIKGIYGLSCNTRKKEYNGLFRDFRGSLVEEIGNLEGIHTPFPVNWFTIKDQLEEMIRRGTPYIEYDEYITNCVKAGIVDKLSQKTLLEFLHDLGIVLSFPEFRETNVLNPEWVTKGVYAIIDNPRIIQNKGELDIRMLDELLDASIYPAEKQGFIIKMMQKFQLCVEIIPNEKYLIPDLLPIAENYTGDWKKTLHFQYSYDTYEKRIFSRFLVNMFSLVHMGTYWRNGVVLQHEGNKALIKADSLNRIISINIDGNPKTRRSLLAIIRKDFSGIHGSFTNLSFEEKIGHPRFPEILRGYHRLVKMEENNIEDEFVEELELTLPVRDWLDGVESYEERKLNRLAKLEDRYKEKPQTTHTSIETNEDKKFTQIKLKEQEIEKLEREISESKDKIEKYDEEARAHTRLYMLVPFGLFVLVTVAFSYSVFWKELIDLRVGSFFYGIVMLLIAFFFSYKNLKEWSFTKFPEQMFEKEKKRLYEKFGISLEEYHAAQMSLNELKRELKSLNE